MYDAIVVGARCAGSPTAMLLSRKGYRVLLVDRARFPSDTMSTHFVWQPAVALLARWNLLDRLVASGCPPHPKLTLDLGAVRLMGSAPPAGSAAEFYVPRRKVLDKLLADAAVEAGAELREDFLVLELTTEGSRVTGIRGRSSSGAPGTELARIVVGADGMRSAVARAVRAPVYQERPPLTCWYYTYWSGVETEGAEWYGRDGRAFAVASTHDGLAVIPVIWKSGEFVEYRADIEGNYLKTLDLAPELAERVRSSGRREDRFVGTADLPNFFRKPYGNGWALVGDAGYHKDPITGFGITDALRDAELLAGAADAGLAGREPMEAALARYESARNAASMELYRFTCDLARLEGPSPMMLALMAALRDNPADTRRFMGTVAATVAMSEFYAPNNLMRIMRAGGRA